MARRVARGVQTRAHVRSGADVPAALWPILKRVPKYLRLAWALVREPAIPRRDKTLLYSLAAYSVSPLSLVTGTIPIVGQVDGIVLLLLGINQALKHCPPDAAREHLARLKLPSDQFQQDLATIKTAAVGMGRQAGIEARYVGRVAGGFGRRLVRRLLDDISGGP